MPRKTAQSPPKKEVPPKENKDDLQVDQAGVDLAAAQEQALLAQAQTRHLEDRVVMLRALTNRQKEEIDKLRQEVKNLKAKRPARATAAKKAAPPSK